jgi:hypothetical protein
MANAESSTLFELPGEGYQYQEKYGVSFFIYKRYRKRKSNITIGNFRKWSCGFSFFRSALGQILPKNMEGGMQEWHGNPVRLVLLYVHIFFSLILCPKLALKHPIRPRATRGPALQILGDGRQKNRKEADTV